MTYTITNATTGTDHLNVADLFECALLIGADENHIAMQLIAYGTAVVGANVVIPNEMG